MYYRTRVSLPDRPGALLAVTKAIADAACNIVDIEVMASTDGRAIDDLMVEASSEEALLAALAKVPGIQVLSLRKTMRLNGYRADLDLLTRIAASPDQGLRIAVELAPGVFHADFAMALETAGDAASVMFRSSGAPLALPAGLPEATGGTPRRGVVRPTPDTPWEVAGTALDGHTLYVVRYGGPVFLQTELLQLRRIAELASALCASEAVALG